jgi:hypothetical protein
MYANRLVYTPLFPCCGLAASVAVANAKKEK